MAKNDPFQIKGIRDLLRKVKKMPEAVGDEVDTYLNAKALEIEADAINRAPVDDGFLKGNITSNTGTYLDKTISSNANYSAYVEFGTGPHVRVPPGLEAFAMQFYVNGKGTTIAQPFLFPAYFKNIRPKKVERDIKRIIERGAR
jgi:HK97 gp10 family phage protein